MEGDALSPVEQFYSYQKKIDYGLFIRVPSLFATELSFEYETNNHSSEMTFIEAL